MTKRNILLLLFLLVFVLAGCRAKPPAETAEPPATEAAGTETPSEAASSPSASLDPQEALTPPPAPAASEDPGEALEEALARMSLEEKVGQLLFVGIEGLTPGPDAAWALQEAKVGGVILFGRNVDSAQQLTQLTNELKERNRAAGNLPLFLCVDEEGGTVSRMPPEVTDLPPAYDFTQAGGDAYLRGEAVATECAAFGFNLDFAPVLDVWSDPGNTVIGTRAFGTDPETVTAAGDSFVQAVMDSGTVIPVAKHFPGHGDTAVDSHVGLPVVDKSRAQLEELELIPFREVIGGERRVQVPGEPVLPPIPAVMVGHILLPQLDPDYPASLSSAVVDGLLREELGFEGVVFTDDLTMGAVTNTYGVGEAAVLAVEAGCDGLLVCHGLEAQQAAYEALLEAAESGRISPERLDRSVGRLLALKEAYGVEDEPVQVPDVEALNARLEAIFP